MVRFKSLTLLIGLTVLIGCSPQLERPERQEFNRAEQKEEQRPASVPTFRYRAGSGLLIEGR
jgi:hypothetical protein